ncbi:hypothetical protein [Alkalihalobacterium alkalinitrilicum]|uniref:hypothetical protein n=1 Tax=Alkalihalobacterium alkalinitrilicum TaxID=427920 RepID=UPI001303074F|nr:hypothetical protein [Alkalihalobacterium alkalinitrilicum]
MVEYARNFFIAVFLGCILFGLFIIGTGSANAAEGAPDSSHQPLTVVQKSVVYQVGESS